MTRSEEIETFNESQWDSQQHHQKVEALIQLCEQHLQDSIVEIEELCEQGVDVNEMRGVLF